MRHSIVLATDVFEPLIPVARAAEKAGFHRVWTTESTARDALVRAVTLALRTERIGVATGIAYAFTRSPLALAATAADAHIASGGRFTLGLGAGTRGMRRRRYGIDAFDHPATRLAEYAAIMRRAWAAEAGFDFEGRFYRASVAGPGHTAELAGLPPIDIVGSGVNLAMLRSAARHSDGVALHPIVSFATYLEGAALPAIRAGAARHVNPGTEPWIAAWRITSVAPDLDEAMYRARVNLGFYFSTPSYQGVTTGSAWEATTVAVRDAFRATPPPSYQELARLIPPEMVREFCLVATPRSLPAEIAALETYLRAQGVAELVFQPAGIGLNAAEYTELCMTTVNASRSVTTERGAP